jgi:hypothetical protein
MKGLVVSILLLASNGFGLPLLDSAVSQELSRATSEPATRFLRDDTSNEVVYPVLSRLVVGEDSKGKPLFRMVQNRDGSADIFVIVQLAPSKTFETEFEEIQKNQPGMKLALLPIAKGTLRVSLVEGNQVQLLAESSDVQNSYLNAQMPLHARVNPEALALVKNAVATKSGVLLALAFDYAFKATAQGASMKFRVDTQKLQKQLINDPEFTTALANGSGLSVEWGQKQVRKALAIDFNPAKPILPLNPVDTDNYPLLAWGSLFDLFSVILLKEPGRSWLSYDALKRIRDAQFAASPEDIASPPQLSTQLVESQAGGLLKGICTKYRDLVYSYDGSTSCDALVVPPSPVSPVVPPVTTPASTPKPGDDEPRPGFDPLLD